MSESYMPKQRAYVHKAKEDAERSPEETVTEYITAYQLWARDCDHWCHENRSRVADLSKGPARQAFLALQKKYCTSKNRQWQRSSDAYFFYGGTYDAQPTPDEVNTIDAETVIISTESKRGPRFRFTVKKQGRIWKLDAVERLIGGRWQTDNL